MTQQNQKSKIVFEVIDPRGKLVVCEENGLCHAIEGHPEVTEEKIKNSILSPDIIRQSGRSERSNLYCSIEGTTDDKVEIFVTVVGFNEAESKGYVRTAYAGNDNAAKGEMIWTQ